MKTLRNSVQLIGHLGANPIVRTTESGQKYARFSMATTDSYKTSDGSFKEETFWHNIIGWGNLAERMEKYLVKGSFILIEGKLTNREYIEPGTNIKKYFTEIRAGNFMMLEKKGTNVQTGIMEEVTSEDESGLPF